MTCALVCAVDVVFQRSAAHDRNITKKQEILMTKKEKLDPETAALIQWCTEVEGYLVAGGATLSQAQEHIEEQVEWFTDMFYNGLSPEEAAKAVLSQ